MDLPIFSNRILWSSLTFFERIFLLEFQNYDDLSAGQRWQIPLTAGINDWPRFAGCSHGNIIALETMNYCITTFGRTRELTWSVRRMDNSFSWSCGLVKRVNLCKLRKIQARVFSKRSNLTSLFVRYSQLIEDASELGTHDPILSLLKQRIEY